MGKALQDWEVLVKGIIRKYSPKGESGRSGLSKNPVSGVLSRDCLFSRQPRKENGGLCQCWWGDILGSKQYTKRTRDRTAGGGGPLMGRGFHGVTSAPTGLQARSRSTFPKGKEGGSLGSNGSAAQRHWEADTVPRSGPSFEDRLLGALDGGTPEPAYLSAWETFVCFLSHRTHRAQGFPDWWGNLMYSFIKTMRSLEDP